MPFAATIGVPLAAANENRKIYFQLLNLGIKGQNVITETNLDGLTTYAGLKSAIQTAYAQYHQNNKKLIDRTLRYLDQANEAGYITDAMVTAAGAESEGSRFSTLLASFSALESDVLTSTRSGKTVARQ